MKKMPKDKAFRAIVFWVYLSTVRDYPYLFQGISQFSIVLELPL